MLYYMGVILICGLPNGDCKVFTTNPSEVKYGSVSECEDNIAEKVVSLHDKVGGMKGAENMSINFKCVEWSDGSF